MIAAFLGTQDRPFQRLLDGLEQIAQTGETVYVQTGVTSYEGTHLQAQPFFSRETMQALIHEADILITHGGAGMMLCALQQHKKTIAMPRLARYGEHVDDHQEELVNKLFEGRYLLKAHDALTLYTTYENIGLFHPRSYPFVNAIGRDLEHYLKYDN